MGNHVAHFAIHADDLERAMRFYETVFGWDFEPWGLPDFYMIDTGRGGISGAIQKRREPASGEMIGYECTVGVADLDAIAAAIVEHGGEIVLPKFHIEGVGWLVRFKDTEGNIAGAMQYEAGYRGS